MADDITLTVRVRDMTRGDLSQIRQRLRGMDGDIRRVGESSGMSSDRVNRFNHNIQSLDNRLRQVGQTGNLSEREMAHMRRTMGLLGRDLSQAARSGEITRDEFRQLSNQLSSTRLDFDHLDRDLRRHYTIAQAAHRDEMQRQRDAARALRQRQQEEERAARAAATRLRQAQRDQRTYQRNELNRFRTAGADPDLTSRVRNFNDGDFNRVTDGLLRMRAAMRGVSGTTDDARRRVDIFNRDMDVMSRILQDARRNGNLTRRDLDALSNGLRVTQRDLRTLSRSGDLGSGSFRTMRREIRGMQGEFRRLGDTDGHLGRLRNGLRGLADRFKHSSQWMKIFIVVLLLIGPAAQAIGALLSTVLVGAFIALGAYALRSEREVRSAFSNMKTAIGSTVRTAAQPMKTALVEGMNMVSVASRKMQPALTAAFTATAPLVTKMAGGIINLAQSALPGLTAALAASGPAMDGFKQAMTNVGQGIGNMFKNMTVGNEEGLQRAWQTLGNELRNLLENIGRFITNMSKSATATTLFIGVFRAFSGVLHLVEAAFKAIDSIASPFFSKLNGWVSGMSSLKSGVSDVTDQYNLQGKSVDFLKKRLDEVHAKMKEQEENYKYLPKPTKDILKEKDGYNSNKKYAAALEQALADATDLQTAAIKNQVEAVKSLIEQQNKLNEQNLNQLDKKAALQQAILDATKASGDYHKALKLQNGELLLNNQAALDAYGKVSRIAQAGNDLAKQLKESNAPWQQQIQNFNQTRDAAAAAFHQWGLGIPEAKALATSMLQIPDVEPEIRVDIGNLKRRINEAKVRLMRVPDSRKAQVRAEIKQLQQKLSVAQAAINALHGTTVTVTVQTVGIAAAIAALGSLNTAAGAGLAGRLVGNARGGLAGFASGGSTQNVTGGGYIQGPGSGTSDSITAFGASGPYMVSNTEFVLKSAAVKKYGVPFLEALNSGKLKLAGFKKGGLTAKQKKAQEKAKAQREAEREARNDAVGDLTISHFGKMAGYKTDEFKKALALPGALGDLVGSLNRWRSVIMKATHGAAESKLLKGLDRAGRQLINYEKKLSKVDSALEKAKSKLDDLKQAAATLRDSVTSGVMSATDITRVAQGDDKNVTMSDIMGRMRESVDKSSAFSQALADLKKRGVSGDVIKQIAEAGIEGGGMETAQALLNGSAADIKKINEMQKKINANAKSAGKTAADAMYAAGIKAAEGMVKGLEKRKKAIEKAMMDIAKAMEKAIKKALKIKSPSRVMEEVGHYTAEGFAVGIKKNSSVDSAWESMLSTGSPAGSGVSSSGNGVHVVQLVIGNRVIDEVILDSNRRTVRTRGGNVQAVFGR